VSADIRIVLVETTHPGNIGAAARAMKNMCLGRLYLVTPHRFPCADATARAAGADDLLARAVVCRTLDEAISDCKIVIGTSARSRSIAWPEVGPRACAKKLASEAETTQAAILFGREHSGLTNAELDRCHYLLQIPCNARFSSLNLAAAVQIVAYELLTASKGEAEATTPSLSPLASSDQLKSFYRHLQQTLFDIGFLQPGKTGALMRRLRRLFNRAQLETKEIDILRGILSAAQGRKTVRTPKQSHDSDSNREH
jgi:tRNA (cytidine32/uridine32-2'-O)-methyltransferase